MTIPNHVQGVAPHSQAVDQVMVAAVNSNRMVTFMVGKETTEPPAFRALAHAFDRYVVFGYLSTTDPSILERFQIKSVPALVTMFAQPDEEEKEKKQEYIDKKSTAIRQRTFSLAWPRTALKRTVIFSTAMLVHGFNKSLDK